MIDELVCWSLICMEDFILGLSQWLQNFIKQKVNIIILLIIVLIGSNIYCIYNCNSKYLVIQNEINKNRKEIKIIQENIQSNKTEQKEEIEKQTKEIKDRIDFRFFVTNKSLSEIHNVEIDTKTGRIIK